MACMCGYRSGWLVGVGIGVDGVHLKGSCNGNGQIVGTDIVPLSLSVLICRWISLEPECTPKILHAEPTTEENKSRLPGKLTRNDSSAISKLRQL
ncbi:hypothetical protein CHS0354_025697 [Potamilus streckersoni]|uniref:Uncharacterized protein n=1 Tax=Potamilus streckersoni TaxID=2493646 RepID=A0AAE0S144_9BIVA|nr:hypothetical protein CHS0354_025697 [Potamilus streckersoni]